LRITSDRDVTEEKSTLMFAVDPLTVSFKASPVAIEAVGLDLVASKFENTSRDEPPPTGVAVIETPDEVCTIVTEPDPWMLFVSRTVIKSGLLVYGLRIVLIVVLPTTTAFETEGARRSAEKSMSFLDRTIGPKNRSETHNHQKQSSLGRFEYLLTAGRRCRLAS